MPFCASALDLKKTALTRFRASTLQGVCACAVRSETGKARVRLASYLQGVCACAVRSESASVASSRVESPRALLVSLGVPKCCMPHASQGIKIKPDSGKNLRDFEVKRGYISGERGFSTVGYGGW